MYTKIHKPSTSGKSVYANKGSAGRIVNYLRSEELKENPNAHIHYQTDKGEMNYGQAVQNIDNHSKDIESGKVKFSALTFNLSQEEAEAVAQGKPEDNRTKKERVGDLTKKLMNEYAKSFPSKTLKHEDLVYVAKVHEHRKKNGELNKENQTHIHIVVSNLTKDKKQYINPETKHRTHFNKVNFQNASQQVASKELGTEIPIRKTLKTEVKKEQTANVNAIENAVKGKYYSPDGQLQSNKDVVNRLVNNKKGLSKSANKVTVVELTPRKGNYFNNPENATKSADKIVENYARSLKKEGTKKEDLVYYYKINTNEAKKEGVGEKAKKEGIGKRNNNEKSPSLEIIISNRNKEMTKSVGANAKSFDFDKFSKLNNQFNNQIEKERNHISPTEKNVNKLNKKFKAGINYKETYQNRWLGKETEEYTQTTKMLDDKFQGSREIYAKADKPIIDKVEQGTKQAVSQGGSMMKRMFSAISQNEDMEILQAIEKRKSQELGIKRERKTDND